MNVLLEEKTTSEGNRLNILLAEDEPSNLLLINRILKQAGHSVTTANNGQEALESLNTNVYDLGIFDMQMPIMSGIDAIKLFREKKEKSKLPFIILTANADKEVMEKCKNIGIDMCLSKPITSTALIEAVDLACGTHL